MVYLVHLVYLAFWGVSFFLFGQTDKKDETTDETKVAEGLPFYLLFIMLFPWTCPSCTIKRDFACT